MGFDAGAAVEKLEYDFRPFTKAHGTTPEPSDDQVFTLMDTIRTIVNEIRTANATSEEETEDVVDAQEAIAILGRLQKEQVEEFREELIQAYSLCTSGIPSADELRELPYRVRSMYFGWFLGQLNRPESAAVDTNSSLRVVNGG